MLPRPPWPEIETGAVPSPAAEAEVIATVASTFARVASGVAAAADVQGVVAAVLDHAVASFGASAAHVLLVDAAGRPELQLAGHRGLPETLVERLSVLPLTATTVAGRAALERELQIYEEPGRLPPDANLAREVVEQTAGRGIVAVPLVAREKLVGVLTWIFAEPRSFGLAERSYLSSLGDLFALGLENARALQAEQRLRARLEAVQEAALAVSESATVPEALQRIVDRARELVGADHAVLGIAGASPESPFDPWVFSGEELEAFLASGLRAHPVGVRGAVVREGRALRLDDVRKDPRFAGFPPGHPELGAFLGVPVAYRGRVRGILYLANRAGGRRFGPEDQRAVELLAVHAALAVEQLVTRDGLAVAQRIAHLGNWDLDAVSGRLTWSDEVFQIFGLTPGCFPETYEAFLAAVHPDDREAVRTAVDAALYAGKPYSLEHRVVRPDGSERIVHEKGEVFRDGELRPVRMVGTVLDVTERRRADAEREGLLGELQGKQAWLQAAIDNSPAGIVILDRDGRFTVNRRAEELWGRPLPTGGRPQGVAQFVFAADGTPLPPDEMPGLLALRRGEAMEPRELLLQRPDGSRAPVLVSASPIRGPQGVILGSIAVLEDIRVLKELERLRKEWTSVIAHDLRQPLSAIFTTAGALARADVPERERERAGRILAAARRLDRMIGDLLEASRIEAGQLVLEREPTDLAALVRAVGERMAPELAGHELRVAAGAGLPEVLADPGRIEQVLANLLSNAARYGAPGTPIELEAALHEGTVEVSVTNQGPGLTPEELGRLFTRYTRTPAARKARPEGLGLGLYICKGIVEAHGGRITAESAPGGPTTFRFALAAG